MVYYSFFIMQSESALKRTMNWFMIGIAIMSFLGLSQAFGHDFFQTKFGQSLIKPSTYKEELVFNFEKGRPYMTLYNPNYVGFYAALTIPVLLTLQVLYYLLPSLLSCLHPSPVPVSLRLPFH